MNTLLFFLENWDKIASWCAALASGYGWYQQAQKTKAAEEREARSSDATYYRDIIESQDKHIDRLGQRLEDMEKRHSEEMRILRESGEARLQEAKELIKLLRDQNETLKKELSHEEN